MGLHAATPGVCDVTTLYFIVFCAAPIPNERGAVEEGGKYRDSGSAAEQHTRVPMHRPGGAERYHLQHGAIPGEPPQCKMPHY